MEYRRNDCVKPVTTGHWIKFCYQFWLWTPSLAMWGCGALSEVYPACRVGPIKDKTLETLTTGTVWYICLAHSVLAPDTATNKRQACKLHYMLHWRQLGGIFICSLVEYVVLGCLQLSISLVRDVTWEEELQRMNGYLKYLKWYKARPP